MATFIPRRNSGLSDALSFISLGQRQEALNRQRNVTALKTAQNKEDRLDALNELQGRGGLAHTIGQALGIENFLGSKAPLTKIPLKNIHAEQLPDVSGVEQQLAKQGNVSGQVTTQRFKESLGPGVTDAEVGKRLSGGDFGKALTGRIGSRAGSDSYKRFAAIDMARDAGVANPESLSDRELNRFLPNARKEVANKERTYRRARSRVATFNRITKDNQDFDDMGPSQYHQFMIDGFTEEFKRAGNDVGKRRKAVLRFRSAIQAGDDFYLTNQARGLDRFLVSFPIKSVGVGRGKTKEFHYEDAGGKTRLIEASGSNQAKRRLRGQKFTNLRPASKQATGEETDAQRKRREQKEREFAFAVGQQDMSFQGEAEKALEKSLDFNEGDVDQADIDQANTILAQSSTGNAYRWELVGGKPVKRRIGGPLSTQFVAPGVNPSGNQKDFSGFFK